MSRYDVYNLINQYVESDFPEHYGGKRVSGIVEDVLCDNIKRQLEVKFKKGKKYIFRIPQKVVYDKREIVLVYSIDETTDEEILALNKENAFNGKGIDKGIREIMNEECKVVFVIKEKPKERRRRKRR